MQEQKKSAPDMWIWIPEERFPDRQTTAYNSMSDPSVPRNFTVLCAVRSYTFSKPIREISLRVSADTFFRFSLNGERLFSGPTTPAGDFLDNDRPRPHYYATRFTVRKNGGFAEGRADFSILVRMAPGAAFEYSKGHGGLLVQAEVLFADGTGQTVATDESWQMTVLPSYVDLATYDGRIAPEKTVNAVFVPDIWHAEDAPISPCREWALPLPEENARFTVDAGQTDVREVTFDRIWAGRPLVRVCACGRVSVSVRCSETGEQGTEEHMIFDKDDAYLGTWMHSAGKLILHTENASDAPCTVSVFFIASAYPVNEAACGVTVTSDEALNRVLDVCAHTMRICRQVQHVDSPRHCEPLACTGDYYVTSLMEAFSVGDLSLAVFDAYRTGELIRHQGRLFHTSFSLIWVQMLWDLTCFTGQTKLLADTEEALGMVLSRNAGYLGENELIEYPPDYMFLDWLYPDDISLHHPPKALGQTCMTLFYYGALRSAEKIYTVLGDPAAAAECVARAARVKDAVLSLLYDKERGLFFEGLNTPTRADLLGRWMPQNVSKRYYRAHANILAAYCGVLPEEECRALLDRVMTDDSLGKVQPYFKHFLLEAVYRCGLRETYTRKILEEWKPFVEDCPKGLTEGFYPPEPGYPFDHSHAWGGTPLYALPLALSGLQILRPGFAEICLSPSLLGLDSAHVEIPTPKGKIVIDMKKDTPPVIRLPEGVTLRKE